MLRMFLDVTYFCTPQHAVRPYGERYTFFQSLAPIFAYLSCFVWAVATCFAERCRSFIAFSNRFSVVSVFRVTYPQDP